MTDDKAENEELKGALKAMLDLRAGELAKYLQLKDTHEAVLNMEADASTKLRLLRARHSMACLSLRHILEHSRDLRSAVEQLTLEMEGWTVGDD